MSLSPNPRILYIDDYSDSCKLIDILLYTEKCKYSFSIANSPSEALELIASEPFNLYILENKLPEMTGVELCRKIRQTDKQTPILFFSGKARPFDRETSLNAGATEYLVKSDDRERITETIRELLNDNHNCKSKNQSSCCLTK
jgi:CheY-like chemotaxis protein